MALALPALDHPMPDEADHLTKGETARWSLGAGTALALRLGHRIADDIDIFVTGIALGELAPSRNPDTRAIRPHAQWPGHYLKVEGDEGEIDFLSSALQTTPGFSVELFRGRAIALDPAGTRSTSPASSNISSRSYGRSPARRAAHLHVPTRLSNS